MPLKMKVKPGQEQNAVYHGPTFGGGHDLHVSDSSNSNNNSYIDSNASYDGPNGKTGEEGGKFIHGNPSLYFQTVEVEVFQIV